MPLVCALAQAIRGCFFLGIARVKRRYALSYCMTKLTFVVYLSTKSFAILLASSDSSMTGDLSTLITVSQQNGR